MTLYKLLWLEFRDIKWTQKFEIILKLEKILARDPKTY